MPPPADLDTGYRKGWGKGKGKQTLVYPGGELEVTEARAPQPEGLIVGNVPSELNSMNVLNSYFRKFGEVLKITVQPSEGRAFIQFAERSAVEAAAGAPVLDRPEITLAFAQKEKGKGKKGKGKDRPTHLDKPAEHRVLCNDPEEQRRLDDHKRKRDEITNRRSALLSNLTDQLKSIMAKLNEEGVPEARREALTSLILQIKEKMNAVSNPESGGTEDAAKGKKRQKGDAAGDGKGGSGGDGKGEGKKSGFTLDLRPKVLRVNLVQGWTHEKLREELNKQGAPEDKIVCVHVEEVEIKTSDESQPTKTALVQFKDRRSAEAVFNNRGNLKCAENAEWCNELPPVTAVSPTAAVAVSPLLKPELDPSPLPPAASAAGSEGAEATTGNSAEPNSGELKAEEPTAAAALAAASSAAADAASSPAASTAAEGASEGAAVPAAAAADAAPAAEASAAGAAVEAPKEGAVVAPAAEAEGGEATAQFRVDLSEEEDEPAAN